MAGVGILPPSAHSNNGLWLMLRPLLRAAIAASWIGAHGVVGLVTLPSVPPLPIANQTKPSPVASADATSIGSMGLREQVCYKCYRECPIACFAGVCGLGYTAGVRRFEATSQCYTCDQAESADYSETSSLKVCTPHEARATVSYQRSAAAVEALMPDPTTTTANPAFPGSKEEAEKQAKLAEQLKIDEAHKIATQIRANDARLTSEAAHQTWLTAMHSYNEELVLLRKAQLRTEALEKTMNTAESASEKARQDFLKLTKEAKEAREAVQRTEDALSGADGQGDSASLSIMQAGVEERRAMAQVAAEHRQIAAAEALDASRLRAASGDAPGAEGVIAVPWSG